MFIYIIDLLALVSTALAHPYTYIERDDWPVLNGSCENADTFPPEEQFTIGYQKFCDQNYDPKATGEASYKYMKSVDGPTEGMITIRNRKKNDLRWYFEVKCRSKKWGVGTPCYVNNAMCKRRYAMMLDSNDAGGLGTAYCVVDNTGGDGLGGRRGKPRMSGEGLVLVMPVKLQDGGYHEQVNPDSWVTWDHYQNSE